MKKFGKIAAIVMATSLTVTAGALAAGCGGKKSKDFDGTVTIWTHLGTTQAEAQVYDSLAESYNSMGKTTADGKPVKVEIVHMGKSGLDTALSSSRNKLADIITVDAPNIADRAKFNILVDMSEYVTAEEKADYVDSVLEQGTINNKLYALSAMDAPTALYCNTDIVTEEVLKKAGISGYATIENPWSWNDIVAILDAVGGAKGKIALNAGFGDDAGPMYMYSSLVYSAGGTFFANNTYSGNFDGAKAVAGVSMLETIYKGGYLNDGGSNAHFFASGAIAFQIYGPWDIRVLAGDAYKSTHYKVLPMPVYVDAQGNKGKAVAGCGSYCLGVTDCAPSVEWATDVVKYFTSAEASELFYLDSGVGTFPTHKSTFETLDEFTKDGPSKDMANIFMNIAVARPRVENYNVLRDAYRELINYVRDHCTDGDYNLQAKATSIVRKSLTR